MKQISKERAKYLLRYFWTVPLLGFYASNLKGMCPNTDAYFIMATGRYIIENGTIPTINPFVIHENFGIVIQQWLFDIMTYGIYCFGGYRGLYIYTLAMLGLSLFLIYKFASLFVESTDTRAAVTAITSYCTYPFSYNRPGSISMINLLLLLILLTKYRDTKDRRYLYPLPFISLLEINMHASMWPFLFVFTLPFIIPKKFSDLKSRTKILETLKKDKELFAAMGAMFAAGFLNPYGLKGMGYVFLTIGSITETNFIAEMQSAEVMSEYGFIVIGYAIALALAIYKCRDRLTLMEISLAAGTLILGMDHLRSFNLMAIGMVPVLSILIGEKNFMNYLKTERQYQFAAFMGGFAVLYFSASVLQTDFHTAENNARPVQAAEYLSQYDAEDIVLYTSYDNGAFMQWNGYKVYINASAELSLKSINGQKDIYGEYYDVYSGDADYEAFMDEYEFTHLIVAPGSYLELYMELTGGYERVVETEYYSLFEAENFGQK